VKRQDGIATLIRGLRVSVTLRALVDGVELTEK
jgi:hypothetical protein